MDKVSFRYSTNVQGSESETGCCSCDNYNDIDDGNVDVNLTLGAAIVHPLAGRAHEVGKGSTGSALAVT